MSRAEREPAKKEALLREVNEQIEAVNANLPADDPTMEVLCECDASDCHEPVNITRAEYESVRAVPTHFVVLPGHEDADVERVVSTNERFLVVEKTGQAGREAEATDPRT
jgi:hypothetical protein